MIKVGPFRIRKSYQDGLQTLVIFVRSEAWISCYWTPTKAYRRVTGNFGPETLRTQDISVPVPKCPETLRHWCRTGQDTSHPVPKCTDAEVSENTLALRLNWSEHFGPILLYLFLDYFTEAQFDYRIQTITRLQNKYGPKLLSTLNYNVILKFN